MPPAQDSEILRCTSEMKRVSAAQRFLTVGGYAGSAYLFDHPRTIASVNVPPEFDFRCESRNRQLGAHISEDLDKFTSHKHPDVSDMSNLQAPATPGDFKAVRQPAISSFPAWKHITEIFSIHRIRFYPDHSRAFETSYFRASFDSIYQ